jgi:biopolymer transport protein ExbD
MRFRRNNTTRVLSILDITPLANVVFLLLILLLVSMGSPFPFTEIRSWGSSGTGSPITKTMTVVVMPEQITIDGKPAAQQTLAALPRDRDIVILASRNIPYFKMIEILDVLRASGHTRLSLATRPLPE